MKPVSNNRAILFDIGWTLIYPNPTRKEAAEKYLLALGYSIPPEVLESANSETAEFYRSHRWKPQAMQDIVQFWQKYYMIYVEHLGIDDPDLPVAFNNHANKAIRFHLYPETLPVLRELRRRGYLIGAVSNWSTELPEILEKLRLIDYLDSLVVSDQIGYHKPQPEIFRHALNSLVADASEAVHIGDDLEADVEGARRAGIRPIWLDRGGTGKADQSYRIQSLEELLSMTLIG